MTIYQSIRESVSTYLDYVTKTRPIVELSDLSDHQLNAIGIPRDELTRHVSDEIDSAVSARLRVPRLDLAEMYRVRNRSFE